MFNHKKILKLRKIQGLTQKELSSLLKVTDKTISNWELGKSKPTVRELESIVYYFNIPVSDLFKNDSRKKLK